MREAGREWETEKERGEGSRRQKKTENGKNICIDPGEKYTFGEKRQRGNMKGRACAIEKKGRRERGREREKRKIFVLIAEQKKTFALQGEKTSEKSGNQWQHLH